MLVETLQSHARRDRILAAASAPSLLQREQEANRLKDEFLATLSHELRTPLNAIVGWVHLLRHGQLPEEERRHAIDRIDRNAHAQAKLVQDLLDVSRITTGKLHLDVREIDLAAVANNAIDACRPAADARQVTIVTQFAGAFPTKGDPDRLQQVVWNLLSNAVRFTPANGRVLVSIARTDGFDTLRVRDTGAGIDPQFVPYRVRALPAGRWREHARARRARHRADHRPAADGDARRHGGRGERWPRARRHVHGHAAGARHARRPRGRCGAGTDRDR